MKALAVVVMILSGAASLFPAAALASKFTGVCTLSGSATLSPGIGPLPKASNFTFNTDGGSANTCSGKLDGVTITHAPASAIANGYGNLACSASSGNGYGYLSINGKEIWFNLKIVGTGPQVTLVLTGVGGGKAVGQATFATDTTAATQCAAKNATNLTFLIAASAVNLAE